LPHFSRKIRKSDPRKWIFFVLVSFLVGSHGDRVLCIPDGDGVGAVRVSLQSHNCRGKSSVHTHTSITSVDRSHATCTDIPLVGDPLITSNQLKGGTKYLKSVTLGKSFFVKASAFNLNNSIRSYFRSNPKTLEIASRFLLQNVKKVVLLH
jgi:hypothetical protein